MLLNRLKTKFRQHYRDFSTLKLIILLRYKGINPKAYVTKPCRLNKNIKMGAYAHLSAGCSIGPKVTIGNYTMVGPEVCIALGEHRFDIPGVPIIFSGRDDVPDTVIEEDVWIGARAIVRAGVTVGRGAIIGMGAIVVKNVPPYTIVGGVPAKIIGNRFDAKKSISIHDYMISQKARAGIYCER